MPIDVVKQNGLLDRYVSDLGVAGQVAATDHLDALPPHAFGIGRPAPTLTPRIRLDLSVRARRVESPHPHT